jgi:hypothetical protein
MTLEKSGRMEITSIETTGRKCNLTRKVKSTERIRRHVVELNHDQEESVGSPK